MDDKDKRLQGGAQADDQELPGFKVNYNGSEPEEAGEGEDMSVQNDAVTGKAVQKGAATSMAAENSPVTRGEAEIKPVMLENESMGGADETALKTAPVGSDAEMAPVGSDGRFAGSASEATSGGLGGTNERLDITEAEARAMLIEDNARAKEDLKKANAKGKKTLVAVIVLAVVLIIAGVAMSVILGGMKGGTGEGGPENGDKQEGNGGENVAVVEKPGEGEEEGGGPGEVVELSLDDEVVKQLRHVFRQYRGIKGFGWLSFYYEVLNGGLSDATMLRQAIFNSVGTVECVGEKSEENWAEACYDGQEVLEAVKRIFGREITLYDGLSTGGCAEIYDAANGIFIGNYRCGGSGPHDLRHDFVAAEKEGDKIYLYEAVVIKNNYDEDGEEVGYYTLAPDAEWMENDGKVLGEKLAIDPSIWLSTEVDAENGIATTMASRPLRDYADQLSQFKWTFRKNDEGNYVFEGLMRVR